ncbi:MAG: response regulator transcription factor [Oscillospiraceae bacterium]|nr:response regulator transcription factor [Oscillospiraceae bacterium]
MNSILVVEGESRRRKAYVAGLRRGGYEAVEAETADQALQILDRRDVDLAVCSAALPDMDGVALVRELRGAYGEMPILLVEGENSIAAKREGFQAGCDDYMVRPADLEELLLRVQALLRRARLYIEKRIQAGGTVLRYDKLTLERSGAVQVLPQKEFYLLYKLLSHPGVVFTRQQLMDAVWGVDSQSDARTVDVHIAKLRERLRDSPDVSIVTVRGLGYKAVLERKDPL